MVEKNQNVASGNTETGNEVNNSEVVKTDENSKNVEQNETKLESPKKQEKLLTQSEVDKLVYAKKMEERDKAKREFEAIANSNKGLDATVSSGDPNKITISRDELSKTIQEESTRIAMRTQADTVARQFGEKIVNCLESKKYDDFEEVVGRLGIPNMSGIEIDALNRLDNMADVLYDLGKNPAKFSNVLTLMGRSPQLAYGELCKLSGSIKKNEDAIAKNADVKVNKPLDQVKPSNAGTDNGIPTDVKSLRQQPWLKG